MRQLSRLLLIPVLFVLCSCARIRPAADFERAQVLVEQSTGLGGLYQPQSSTENEQVIAAQLTDGLTLEEVERIALLNNRELQQSVIDIGISHAEFVQAGLVSNPVFSLMLRFPDGGGRSNLEANVAQSISDLWLLPNRKEKAGHGLDRTILQVARKAGEIVSAVREAFYESLAASMLVETASERVSLAREVHRAVKVLREAGTVGALDENLANGELLRAELELREAEFEERRALRTLSGLLSLDIQGRKINGSLESQTAEEGQEDCLEDRSQLFTVAGEKRLDLQAFKKAVEEARANVRLAKWSIMPDLGLGVAVERLEKASGEVESGVAHLLGPQASMSIPLFDQNQAQVAISRMRKAKAEKEFEQAQILVAQEIADASDRALTAKQVLEFYAERLLPQAKQNLEYARISYEGGESSLLTLIESQRALLEARRGLIGARLHAKNALVELEKAVGVPLVTVCFHEGE